MKKDMEKELFNIVESAWSAYKRHLYEKEDCNSPMNVERVDESLAQMSVYYDDHPLTKWDEGQTYNIKKIPDFFKKINKNGQEN